MEQPKTPPADRFDVVWERCDAIPGWLKRGQAEMLYTDAMAVSRGGTILEIGSHQGRSTVVLAAAAQQRGLKVVAVDPFVEGALFGGRSTRDRFEEHLAAAGATDVVSLLAEYSTKARATWEAPIDLLYIDGKHDYWTFTDDLLWRAFLPAGGRVLVHDAFSSIGVTLGILAKILFAGDLTYLGRSDSMARFEVRRPSGRDRVRIVGELPWWLRNVFLKVLLRLHLRPLARVLGHDSPYDPY